MGLKEVGWKRMACIHLAEGMDEWQTVVNRVTIDFHIHTMHLDIKVIYSPTNAQVIVLKTILKFALKYLRHVSVQSHHLQGAHYPCLLKLHFIKIVNYGTSVCDEFGGDVAAYIGRSWLLCVCRTVWR
jgi:hypothetical protein